ncbi:protein NUCLEAR FUSION DEFECTIVE 6, chloroplastic/mitochondrial-like [Phalaenopsis equestris]|uniref:protein NUCLEAR FUSION DEFECTIVE 6, chloroplastic/mitochondrial-like n=1 Tax=Phalaenopsis equestris TaxID=78828 RepID=UPI0009E51C54|nr:protein NUCLEAR FUSION DEFECTIVE 6, chloroplastic/mitochondrial-like [Phalaenopsis equestris]
MASSSLRFMIRSSLHTPRPPNPTSKALDKAATAVRSPFPPSTPKAASRSSVRRVARSPLELSRCSYSLFPLHTAVAAARLTSRLSFVSQSCRALSQADSDGP